MGGSSNSATDSTASIIIVPGEGIARVLDLGAGRGFWSLLVSQELRNRSQIQHSDAAYAWLSLCLCSDTEALGVRPI